MNELLSIPAPGVLANDEAEGGEVDDVNVATTEGGSAALFPDGRFIYEPATDFEGTDTFTYTITNAMGTSDPATVSVEVMQLPVAVDDDYASPKDAVLSVPPPGLLANDEPSGGVADERSFSTTAGASVTIFDDGRLLYEPASGFSGIDTFEYTISNAGGTSSPATVTVEVPEDPWVAVDPLPVAMSRNAGAVVDGVFYVLGGEESGGGRNGQVFALDRASGTWDDGLSSMPTGVSNYCAAAVGTDIYVVGGYTGTEGIADLQRYDTVGDAWTTVATDPLPDALFASTCAAYDGRIYVFGGSATGVEGTTSWMYDPGAPEGARWTDALSPVPVAVNYAAAVAVGDQIFVVGGTTADSDGVYGYDPVADDWTTYPSLLEGRGGPAAWVSGSKLYVGGGGWSTYSASVEVYDTSLGTAGTWTSEPDMLVGRRTFAYASDTENGWFYAASGYAGDYLDDASVGLLRALVQ